MWLIRCSISDSPDRFIPCHDDDLAPRRQACTRLSSSDNMNYRYGKYYNTRDGRTRRVLLYSEACLKYIEERTDDWAQALGGGNWKDFNRKFEERYDGFGKDDMDWASKEMTEYLRKDKRVVEISAPCKSPDFVRVWIKLT